MIQARDVVGNDPSGRAGFNPNFDPNWHVKNDPNYDPNSGARGHGPAHGRGYSSKFLRVGGQGAGSKLA